MRVHIVSLPLLVVLPAALVAANKNSLRILHRIYHPSLASQPFTDRGVLALTGSGPVPQVSLVPSDAVEADLSAFVDATQIIEYDRDLTLYQLALEHPGDTHHSQWHVSAVKACHALASTASTLTLHLAADGTPFALDYFVAPVPHNGACPKLPKSANKSKDADGRQVTARPDAPGVHESVRAFVGLTNTTVLVRAPTMPPLPQLRTPPPLTAEGKPFQPPQEQSFLQKYWFYIVAVLIALAISPGGGDEEGQGQGRGGQGGRR